MKILSILLAAVMLIMAAGCSADGTPSVNDPEPAEKDTEPVGEEIPAEPQIPKYTLEDVELDLPEGSVNLTICRDFYGEIYLVESKNRVIKLSDNELIVAVGDPELNGMTRQYLVNTDDLSATSLLPEELSGNLAAARRAFGPHPRRVLQFDNGQNHHAFLVRRLHFKRQTRQRRKADARLLFQQILRRRHYNRQL